LIPTATWLLRVQVWVIARIIIAIGHRRIRIAALPVISWWWSITGTIRIELLLLLSSHLRGRWH
jgi:hypothetical protein